MFVDNVKIIGVKRLRHINKVKQKLVAMFKIVDMGSISFHLGFKVEKNLKKSYQSSFSLHILRKSCLNITSIKLSLAKF